MFKGDLARHEGSFKVGDFVSCYGTLGLYKPKGQFQFRVSQIKPKGQGQFWENFQKLKDELSKEGLFDLEHKKILPKYIKNICLITSLNGVVKEDIIKIIRSRATYQKITIYPVSVQGKNASGDISKAIECLNKEFEFDVIILARGGGSIEDLWPFNEEIVARAIHHSNIPIISAIGHETDYTIADFVSDKRASTPSDAAEMVSINQHEMLQYIDDLLYRINSFMERSISTKKDTVVALSDKKIMTDPLESVRVVRENIKDFHAYLNIYLDKNIDAIQSKLKVANTSLNSINPYNVLNRGYTFLLNKNRENISSIKSTNVGDQIYSLHSDGELELEVLGKHERKKRKK